ncbi:DUF2917 domain-containing protein [Denitromonas iodatirespirans]|uniref:DUF2917 domain-containing protein n=1 Tax=Denitromonas iodatirespirans TaxID=2795389 RepID=A0A944D9W5_DENI1|nr:DUF2917 domain-containing protein [Denitromonas iodatirespirans]MBT0961216.1 DUF2917 domain-containing protein [Denitromonas iodatirespirans]
MKATLTQTPQDLAAGSLRSITDFQGGSVRCLRGRLWITAEGHAQDVWLTAGGTLALPDPGKVVIQADIDSTVSLVAPPSHLPLTVLLQQLRQRLQRHTPATAAIGPNGKVMC